MTELEASDLIDSRITQAWKDWDRWSKQYRKDISREIIRMMASIKDKKIRESTIRKLFAHQRLYTEYLKEKGD